MTLLESLQNVTIRSQPPERTTLMPPETRLDPKTTEIIDNFVATTRERDDLRRDNEALRARAAHDADRIAFYEAEIAKLRHERDFYQRHSTSLYTRLSDINLVIDTALEEAKNAAYAPSQDRPKPETSQPSSDDGTAALAAKLAPVVKAEIG